MWSENVFNNSINFYGYIYSYSNADLVIVSLIGYNLYKTRRVCFVFPYNFIFK